MLSPADIAQLKDIFVSRDDCNDRHTSEAEKITELTVQQAKITTQLGLLIKERCGKSRSGGGSSWV